VGNIEDPGRDTEASAEPARLAGPIGSFGGLLATTCAGLLVKGQVMRVVSILQDVWLKDAAEAKKNCGNIPAAEQEDVAQANADGVFEFACRSIVMKSLPGWIEEICAEHLQSVRPALRAD
jgi:hypothetical protein